MVESKDLHSDIAAVNGAYAEPPRGAPARLWRWTLRLVAQVRRQYLSRMRPRYVRRVSQFRRGDCRKCGSCCNLTFHCPFLDQANRCNHYEKRNVTCRDFPHDPLDLRLTRVPCGHYFEKPVEGPDVRIPLAKYGIRELVVFGGLAVAGIGVSAVWALYLVPVFVLALGFVLYFFRDPERQIPATPKVLVSPADGKVVELSETEEKEFLRRRAIKIGIFMSPLDVHVNRFPCRGRVEAVAHRPGRYHSALNPSASQENESNAIAILSEENGQTPILLRQVAGVLARRIVCQAAEGDRLQRGERFGMIKFGSRAEVYVPVESGFQITVRLGQRVKAGETILGTFQ